MRGRQHPNMVSVQKSLFQLWRKTDENLDLDLEKPVMYIDRMRIRTPGGTLHTSERINLLNEHIAFVCLSRLHLVTQYFRGGQVSNSFAQKLFDFKVLLRLLMQRIISSEPH
jgi:hypothetical protein